MMKNLILGLMALAALAGCRSVKYVPVETVRTDSVYIHSLTRDSIRLVDSVYVREKGDTVYLEKYRYLYRDRLLRDTLYVTKTDSVTVETPVYVEKQAKWYDKGFMWVGRICCAAALLCGVFLYLKRKFCL